MRLDAKYLPEYLGCHHLLRRTGSDNLAVRERNDVVRVSRRVVEVVDDQNYGASLLPVQPAQQVEHLQLVVHVKVRSGLVEKQHLCLLRERHRDPGSLSLAAGERINRPVGEVHHPGNVERACDGFLIRLGPAIEPAVVRIPPLSDEIPHREPFGCDGGLRQDTELPCQLPRGHPPDGAPIQVGRAAARLEEPGKPSQQR